MTLPAVSLFRLTVVTGLFLIHGCRSEGSRVADSVNHAAEPGSGVPAPVPGIQVSLDIPDTVGYRAAVPVVIRIANTTTSPVDLYLRGREVTFDIVVSDTAGAELWRRLEGESIPAILQLKTLGAGEVIQLSAEWNQRTRSGRPVGSGDYLVQVSVITDGTSSLLSNSARLSIVDR